MLCWLATVASALQLPSSTASSSSASSGRHVTFINPLEVDGFREPGGWGNHADPSQLPLLVFLPGTHRRTLA